MKKALTLILAIITALTLVVSIVSTNAELWSIPMEWITIASSILLAIKQFIEQSGLLTADEAAQFANYYKGLYTKSDSNDKFTAYDVKNWKSNR